MNLLKIKQCLTSDFFLTKDVLKYYFDDNLSHDFLLLINKELIKTQSIFELDLAIEFIIFDFLYKSKDKGVYFFNTFPTYSDIYQNNIQNFIIKTLNKDLSIDYVCIYNKIHSLLKEFNSCKTKTKKIKDILKNALAKITLLNNKFNIDFFKYFQYFYNLNLVFDNAFDENKNTSKWYNIVDTESDHDNFNIIFEDYLQYNNNFIKRIEIISLDANTNKKLIQKKANVLTGLYFKKWDLLNNDEIDFFLQKFINWYFSTNIHVASDCVLFRDYFLLELKKIDLKKYWITKKGLFKNLPFRFVKNDDILLTFAYIIRHNDISSNEIKKNEIKNTVKTKEVYTLTPDLSIIFNYCILQYITLSYINKNICISLSKEEKTSINIIYSNILKFLNEDIKFNHYTVSLKKNTSTIHLYIIDIYNSFISKLSPHFYKENEDISEFGALGI